MYIQCQRLIVSKSIKISLLKIGEISYISVHLRAIGFIIIALELNG